MELIERLFGLRLTNFICATTDTTSAAFDTIEVIDFIAQLPCFAQSIAFHLKHAVDTGLLASVLQGIHDLLDCYVKIFSETEVTFNSWM